MSTKEPVVFTLDTSYTYPLLHARIVTKDDAVISTAVIVNPIDGGGEYLIRPEDSNYLALFIHRYSPNVRDYRKAIAYVITALQRLKIHLEITKKAPEERFTFKPLFRTDYAVYGDVLIEYSGIGTEYLEKLTVHSYLVADGPISVFDPLDITSANIAAKLLGYGEMLQHNPRWYQNEKLSALNMNELLYQMQVLLMREPMHTIRWMFEELGVGSLSDVITKEMLQVFVENILPKKAELDEMKYPMNSELRHFAATRYYDSCMQFAETYGQFRLSFLKSAVIVSGFDPSDHGIGHFADWYLNYIVDHQNLMKIANFLMSDD